jgi:hypothetical protein
MTEDLDPDRLPPEDALSIGRWVSLQADVDRTIGDLVRRHGHDDMWRTAALCRVLEDVAGRLSAVMINGDDGDAHLVRDLARGARPILIEILELSDGAAPDHEGAETTRA